MVYPVEATRMKSLFELRKHRCRVERTSVSPKARLQRLTTGSASRENRMQTHDVLAKKSLCILSFTVLATSLANPSLGWCRLESDSASHELTSLCLSDCEPRNSSCREGAESVLGMKVDEEERAQLLEEQKAYDREEMNTERIMSTRNKILDFWQTLE